MELRTNYQYTYFIYPFAIKEENYERYISNLIKNKNYQIKFFDSFKDVDLYKYFVPNVKQTMFQDFSFIPEKIKVVNKLKNKQILKLLKEQKCLVFDYLLENNMQGKLEEKDGIFFDISKIELICFNTGICFLLIKTHLLETNKFSDLLNFNYKFGNINFENKNIKKLKNIKIQNNMFGTMEEIGNIINYITGKKIEGRQIDIDENVFLTYTYACLESNYWNKNNDFENIANEFIKLSEVKHNDTNINIDYDKLSLLANSSYRKMRINNKCVATICSSTDTDNYTKFPEAYENQYLYTYIISLHQRYYLKKLNKEFKKCNCKILNRFINFNNNIWISELTNDSFGQKMYKRCKEKLNLEELYLEAKNKYDIYYKKLKIDKYMLTNKVFVIISSICLLVGIANLISWQFLR